MNATAALRFVPASALTRPSFAARTEFDDAPAGIDLRELSRHVTVIRHKVAAGKHVYRTGQPFRALFLIHAGHIKTSQIADDGREQVTGFHMRGDLIGVESIGVASHSCEAVALEDSEVWELPYPPVLEACAAMPEMSARLTAALAAEIRRERSWLLALGTLTAEQRVAAFLLDVAARHAALGFSPTHFILRMGRADIGSFLALKHETVTRALTHLCGLECIAVQRREVHILDQRRLRATMCADPRVH